jgi:hypothetical protein
VQICTIGGCHSVADGCARSAAAPTGLSNETTESDLGAIQELVRQESEVALTGCAGLSVPISAVEG